VPRRPCVIEPGDCRSVTAPSASTLTTFPRSASSRLISAFEMKRVRPTRWYEGCSQYERRLDTAVDVAPALSHLDVVTARGFSQERYAGPTVYEQVVTVDHAGGVTGKVEHRRRDVVGSCYAAGRDLADDVRPGLCWPC
jgi:hypothetical protein